MANAATPRTHLGLLAAALVPHPEHHDHSKDPPALLPLPVSDLPPETRQALELLLDADQGIRADHERSAVINLDLAETRLRLAISHGDRSPALQTALERIALAREEVARRDSRRACAALADAVRAVAKPH